MTELARCASCGHSNLPTAKFCNECGTKQIIGKEAKAVTPTAERRLLTVLFCDLVDSTLIAESLDPEETRSIIRRFQALSKTIIDSLGGRITEYLGDGIVAQFTRNESNAERAVNAALRIVRELEIENIVLGNTGTKAAVRCGIASGLAVVGDMLGDEHIRSEVAIGLPLNLAARLQSVAQVGEVIVGETTHKLTDGLFAVEYRGEHQLKGISMPQAAWQIIAEQSISSRFVAHAAELTPMVDRTEIMAELLNTWGNVKRNKGCAVYCVGEAGIGKSRIVTELSTKIKTSTHFQLEYQCAPYHTNTAFYPLISGLEAEAGFEHKDSKTGRVHKLGALVKALERISPNYRGDMPTYCELLSLTKQKDTGVVTVDPDEKKEKVFNSLINTMIALSKSRPVLMKVEDIQWVDPTTMELIERMIDVIAEHPILLLLTSRPGVNPNFVNHANVKTFDIERLPEKYIQELLNQVQIQSQHQLPFEVVDQILKRTEGIPLFIEELSKNILENEKDHLYSSAPSPAHEGKSIPSTLQESLTARLDRLPEETRAIAHLAAVIGRDFDFDLLELVAKYKDKNLYRALTPLLEAQLVLQRQAPPNAKYSFKHALMRDVAYETLLKSDRTTIHKRIVSILERHYPDLGTTTPELLARHASDGDDAAKAAKYWLRAGKSASVKYTLIEARSHLLDAETVLKKLPSTAETKALLLNVLVTLGPVLMALEGSGSKVTKANYQKAVSLCEELAEAEKPDLVDKIDGLIDDEIVESNLEFMALWGQWLVSKDDEADHGLVWANMLEQLSNESDNAGLRLQAQHCLWTTQFHLGDFKTAHRHINAGIALYDPKEHANHASEFGGHDPKVCGSGFLSQVEWLQGNEKAALEHAAECYQWATKLQHKGSILHAIELNLNLHLYRRDATEIKRCYQQLSLICLELPLPEYAGKLSYCEGLVATYSGETKTGIETMKAAFLQISNVGTTEDLALYGEITAETMLKADMPRGALSYIEDTIKLLKDKKVQYWRAEVFRCKGRILMQLGEYSGALEFLLSALKAAEEQQAASLELRAAISIFDLNKKRQLYPEAEQVLRAIYARLPNNATSRDMDIAKKHLLM